MARSKNYVLAVGAAGEERLTILNEICNPYTQDFMHRVGLKPGMELLEIGCGTGIMTNWLAQQVGPSGKITAIDISEEQLEIAKKRANEAGVTNIEFMVLSLEEIAKFNKQFDIIYHRFLLVHIENPPQAIHEMYKILRSSGKLISEEAVGLSKIYPEHPAITKYTEIFLELKKHHKTSAHVGLTLNNLFHQEGFKNIFGGVVAPLLSTIRERSHIVLVIQEVKEKLINANLVTPENLDKLIVDLETIVNNSDYLLTFINFMQICGTKP